MPDYTIIGGGVYGCATARRLAERGAEVVVLERKGVATGASGGPGRRGVRANWRDGRELPLMRAAYPVWEGLHEELGAEGLFERTGNLKLVGREEDWGPAKAQATLQRRMGIETHVLDAGEVRALELDVESGVLGGVYCPLDGVSDHTATTKAYAAAARALGVDIREGVEAAGVLYEGDRAVGVSLSDGGTVEASAGVLLLSNWSVGDLLGDRLELPAWSTSLQVLVSKPLPRVPNRTVVGHMNRTLSLKAEPGGRVMISGGYTGLYDRETHTGRAIPAAIDANVADAVATFPALAGLEVEVADAGHLECFTVDRVPVIDKAPLAENVWFATGWCGHGWAIAPVVSDLLAAFVTDGACPELLQPFALSRFG